MLTRWMPLATLAAALTLTPAAPAADDAKGRGDRPTVLVHLQSLDELVANAGYVAGLVNQADQFDQVKGIYAALNGPKGIYGIDTKKPFALYATLTEGVMDSPVVLMVPVADRETLIESVAAYGVKFKPGEGDTYTVESDKIPLPVYARFANGFAYVTVQNKDAVAAANLKTAAQLPALPADTLASVTLNLDRIPKNLKQIALGQMELKIADEKEKKQPNGTEEERKLRNEFVDGLAAEVAEVFSNGAGLTVRLGVNRKADDLFVETTFAGTSGSKLAEQIRSLGETRSRLAPVTGGDPALKAGLTVTLPPSLRKAMLLGFEQSLAKDKKTPAGLKDLARAALVPTMEAGEIDAAVVFDGPDAAGKFTMSGGFKVRSGKKLESFVREAVKAETVKSREKIQLDALTVDGVKVHRFDFGADYDAQAKRLFGEAPAMAAFADDVAVFAMGPNAEAAVRKALAPAAGAAGPVASFSVAVGKFPFADAVKDEAKAKKIAAEAFGGQPGKDTVAFTLSGGDALRARWSIKGPVFKAIALTEQAKKGAGE